MSYYRPVPPRKDPETVLCEWIQSHVKPGIAVEALVQELIDDVGHVTTLLEDAGWNVVTDEALDGG